MIPSEWSWGLGVTLLGNAAHLMSPSTKEGANLAMQDATELELAIITHPDDLEAALTEYQTALFPRSAVAVAQSAENIEICFRSNAPHGLLEMFAGFQDGRGSVYH